MQPHLLSGASLYPPGVTLLLLSVQRSGMKQNKLPEHNHCLLHSAQAIAEMENLNQCGHKVPATSGKMEKEIKLKCSCWNGVTLWMWACAGFNVFLFMLTMIPTAAEYFLSYLDKKPHYLLPKVNLARIAWRAVVWKCSWELEVEEKEFPHPELWWCLSF